MKEKIQKKINEIREKHSEVYSESTGYRAFVNLIPHVGGALDEVFSHRANSLKHKRLENFISNTEETFQDFEEKKLNKSFLESEEFTDLVLRCIRLSIKTATNEKAKIFSQILRNALSVEGFDLEKFEEIEPLLEQISYREFIFLQELENWTQRLMNDYVKMLDFAHERTNINGVNAPKYRSFFQAFSEDVSKKYGLSVAEIELLEKTCKQKGLIEQGVNYDEIHRISAARKAFGYSMRIQPTLLYRHLIKFIGKLKK